MVRLTREMVARGTSGYMKRRRDETFDQFMSRLTHLYLENKGLSEIVSFAGLFWSVVVVASKSRFDFLNNAMLLITREMSWLNATV